MITLDQYSRVQSSKLVEALRTLTNSYTVDVSYLLEDIQKLENREPANRIEKKNITSALSYLRKIERATFNESLNLMWNFANNRVTSSPIQLVESKQLGLDATDYIVLSGEHVIKVDYSFVAQLLMFDALLLDLGYRHNDLDKQLKDISPIQLVSEDEARKLIQVPDDVIELSKVWRVGESYYYDSENEKMAGFYRLKLYDSEYYRDSCEATLNYTMAIILQDVLSRLIDERIQFNLLNITETSIKFVVPKESIDKVTDCILEEKIELKMFGRSFEIDGKITVY